MDAADMDGPASPLESAAALDPSASPTTPMGAEPERLHSTVHLCQYTLQFESKALEERYRTYSHERWRRLFLRSLPPAALFQLLFGITDYIFFPSSCLWTTWAARLFLIALQLSLFVLAKADLILPRQRLILASTLVYGLTSLTLFGLQRESLEHLDGLYVVFGLAFYAVPKVSPLSFLASLTGSWVAVGWYAALALLVRPAATPWHTALALLYVVPVVAVFNTVMYHYECSARERFVLRDRLRQERISIAVARTPRAQVPPSHRPRPAVLLGIVLWLLLSAAGWASIHDVLQSQLRVERDTAWAWFSHCAGLSVFMLMVTRQTRWIFVFPIFGALVLWGMTHAVPEKWIILSAHGVGYSLLALAAVATLGAFGHCVAAWRQLVAFLRRSCLLYPQLHAGLQRDFPLLETIVRDYVKTMVPQGSKPRDFPRTTPSHEDTPLCSDDCHDSALQSVLLTPKPDMCFFCGKGGAVHLVPCCEAWGPYAQWRLQLTHDAELSVAGSKVTPSAPAQMCTPYSALQLKLKQAEVELQLALWERRRAEERLVRAKQAGARAQAALQRAQDDAARQALQQQHHSAELNRQWAARLESLAADYNRALHDGQEARKALERRLALAEGARLEP